MRSNLQGSLRGRLGYAWGRLLPFVTGGFALGGFTEQSYLWGGDSQGLFNASSNRSMLRAGWTLGAGAEWAMTQLGDPRRISLHRFRHCQQSFDARRPGQHAVHRHAPSRSKPARVRGELQIRRRGAGALVVAADLPNRKDAPVVVLPSPSSPWRGFYAGVNAGGVFDAKSGQAATAIFWDPSLPFGSGVNPNLAYIPGGPTAAQAARSAVVRSATTTSLARS